jgi:hypothetical protein
MAEELWQAAAAVMRYWGSPRPCHAQVKRRNESSSYSYWALRLFCSTFTRLSVQKVQFGP